VPAEESKRGAEGEAQQALFQFYYVLDEIRLRIYLNLIFAFGTNNFKQV